MCDGYYCWNNGICNNDDKCVCTSSYTGRHCRQEICKFVCVCVLVCVWFRVYVVCVCGGGMSVSIDACLVAQCIR